MLAPLPPLELVAERVITLQARTSRARRQEPMDELLAALRSFRAAGIEVDLYLRGTWRSRIGRRRSTVMRFEDLRLDGWELRDSGLYWDPPLALSWQPLLSRDPRPVIVVRAVSGRVTGRSS